MDYILPKMIIGGFVTVTIASVAFCKYYWSYYFLKEERLSI